MRFRAFTVLSALGLTAVTVSAVLGAYQPVPIFTLLAHASTYDRQDVVVTGIVKSVGSYTDESGKKYVIFDLCSPETTCVQIYAWGQTHVASGVSKTVRGQFWAVRNFGNRTVHNEIEAAEGSP